MTAPDRQRDGGPFIAGAVCPWCGVCDLHHLRAPNPEAPPRHDRFDLIDPGPFSHGGITYRPRWDERPFTVIRTCTGCGYEWGQR